MVRYDLLRKSLAMSGFLQSGNFYDAPEIAQVRIKIWGNENRLKKSQIE